MKKAFLHTEVGIGPTRILKWVGSPNSRGIPLIVFVLVYPVAIGSLQEPPVGRELPLPIWIWDLLLGTGIATTLITSRALIKRDKVGISLITWLAAAVIGTLTPVLIAAALTEVQTYVWAGIPASITSNLGLLLIFTVFISAANEFRNSNKVTRDLNWRLQNREAWLNEELRARQLELVRRVFVQIQPALSELTGLLRGENRTKASSALVDLIDQTVRPLSSEIRKQEADAQSLVAKPRLISWSSFSASMKRRVPVVALFSPWLPVLFSLLFFVQISYLANGALGILYLIAFLVLSLVGSEFANQWEANKQLPYLGLLGLNPAVSLLSSLLFLEGGLLLGLQDSEGLFWFTSLGVFLVYLVSGYIGLYVAAQEVINNEVREANNLLSATVAELQLRIASLRRKVSQSVHGDIQASLQATLIRLTNQDIPPKKLVAQLLTDLEQSKLLLEAPEILRTSPDAVAQLVEQWRDISEVSLSISNQAEILVAERDGVRAVVFEIIRERILNAVKHSAAEEIDIAVDIQNHLLKIETRNQDFSSTRAVITHGEGSEFLDEICENWTLKFVGSDVVFQADLDVSKIKG